MRSFLLFALLVGVTSLIQAQGFHSVHSPNGVDVWAVGNNGLVFHSADGGVTWTSMTLGSQTLYSVVTKDLHVWIVGDNGTCYHTSDGGTTWESAPLATTSALRVLVFPDVSTGLVAGDNGVFFRTTDAGSSWTQIALGTSANLFALSFADPSTGYVAGASGTILKTTDIGATWSVITMGMDATGSSPDFYSVAARDGDVYVVGANSTSLKSVDYGATWSKLDFKTDVQSDVNDVVFRDAGHLVFIGGGGYIRTSSNGGSTYQWAIHNMHAPLKDVFFFNSQKGWACSPNNNAIMRTNDGGNTWLLPQGTTSNYSWSQKLNLTGAVVRGDAFSINPFNKNTIYCGLGTRIYASYNRGDTWVQVATMPSGGSKVNSFYVSPKDSNKWVAAYGSPDRIVRSTDHGATWTSVIAREFTEYGMPLEMDGSHPDTLLFGPEDGYLYRSTDFGATWDTLSVPNFRSPCDIVVVRDNPNILWCGDGITGSGNGEMFRSTNGGLNWSLMFTTSGSEIPTVANGDQDPSVGYATAWGSGGVRSTKNFGLTWDPVATTGSTWGVDIAKDDPNVVMYGVYGGGTSYLSTNAGTSFTTSNLSGSNYAVFCYDRATFLTQQSGGVWKYNISYNVPTNTASVSLLSPNGGELWQYGSIHDITWTETSVGSVRIEYKTSPASSWQTIVASTPGAGGSYAWTIPNAPTNQARVRVSNAIGGNPVDSSNAYFSITAAAISSQPSSMDFGSQNVGTVAVDTIRLFNTGTATLVVSSIGVHDAAFSVSRSSFTIPAGGSDTISVLFAPSEVRLYQDSLDVVSNAPGSFQVPVAGTGVPATSVGEGEIPTAYALLQNYPNPFNPVTQISYALPKPGWVTLSVYNMLGQEVATLVNEQQPAGRYTVDFNAQENSELSTGVYIYKLHSGEFSEIRKMVLLK